MGRVRIAYLLALGLLVLLLGGLVYVYASLSAGEQPTQGVVDVSPGLKHVRSIYAYGSGADKLIKQPLGLAFRDGRLYVGQPTAGTILIFDAEGTPLGVIGKKGKGPGELDSPAGIDVDSTGNVYVADPEHAKVVVYDADGKLVRELAGVDHPLIPRVVDDQKLYVAAYDSVKTYALPALQELSSWGKRGRADSQYDFPNGIVVVDGGDTVYVSDGNNMRLKRLNGDGEKVWIVGGPPGGMNDQDRLFGLPAGMTLVGDVLYVADPLNGTIHLFRTSDGGPIGEVGEAGVDEGQFGYPSQIAYMGGKRFAVTEWGNDRVQIVDIDPGAVVKAADQP
jgi:tripartite motif-containing protein 71